MKSLITILLMCCATFIFAQGGKIYLKDAQTANGKKTFVYKSNAVLPENSKANMLHTYDNTSIPVNKVGNAYEFTAQIPDSIGAVYFTIIDSKRKTIDDNFGKGYVVLLKNGTHDERVKSIVEQLNLARTANAFLGLSIPMQDVVNQYDKLYSENPGLKNDDSYYSYLRAKYEVSKEAATPELLAYAQTKAATGNETDMVIANNIYRTLKMGDKSKEITDLALQKYPTGQFAKMNFWSDFYNKQDKTIDNVKEAMTHYKTTFGDSTLQTENRFYQFLIPLYLANKDTVSINKLSNCNELMLALAYNNVAWNLSGQDLTSPGKDLDFAEAISKKSLDLMKNRMEHPKATDNADGLQNAYNNYADTYALLLYKQGKYDEALHYEEEFEKQSFNDAGNKERYAMFAEKAKGAEFAKNYIESQLDNGITSPNLLNQLQTIYNKLNVPETQFEAMKQKAENIHAKQIDKALQDNAKNVQKTLGFTHAIDFELTNLDGKTVKLSDYKGKVVVLDFWATWCGPCRASFPKMQELVTKYKDSNVAFFFIDSFERDTKDKVKANVSKFIADNNYSFNVLFDFEDAVADNYKVQFIPHQFVIDKTGTVIAIDPGDALSTLIDRNM